jgi:mannose/cellobiose epimerase-like protein (N-acyl-D-glucosamine 2-epimerase family)
VSLKLKPDQALQRLSDFAAEKALPLWASAGYDETAQCFHERLRFSGEPVVDVPRRLMVQARQIVVYARAGLAGWYRGGTTLALDTFESVRHRYRAADGAPGWIFSVQPDGRPADRTRELYAHAFVLYMLAWLYRISGEPSMLTLADETLSDIDRLFSSGDEPGYLSRVPGPEDRREQNPHMHLFEALLALAVASGSERYLARANALVRLFDRALADPMTGTVREMFDGSWKPDRSSGENLIEPGHQMEWAWLLREWERLGGVSAGERVSRLVAHATRYGIDGETGLVRSVVRENGSAVNCGSRVWPQTEAIRTLCREDADRENWRDVAAGIMEALFRIHLPVHLNGGWIDRVDPKGAAAVEDMPASSLYHLAGAAMDTAALLKRSHD